MTACRDKRCLRAAGRAHKRELAALRGRNKARRKELQCTWTPGTVGVRGKDVFTVIGWGQSADCLWWVAVSVQGVVTTWAWHQLAPLSPA